MRLRAPFLEVVLRSKYMEIDADGMSVSAELWGRRLYAEIEMAGSRFIYERGTWYRLDEEGRQRRVRGISQEDARRMRALLRHLAQLPRYEVLSELISAVRKLVADA